MATSLDRLLDWNKLTGEHYGSEDQSMFFYAFIKMQRPETILELGTGLGHTAFWMAQALKENGKGHLYTVENAAHWPGMVGLFGRDPKVAEALKARPWFQPVFDAFFPKTPPPRNDKSFPDFFRCMAEVAGVLDLAPWVSFLKGTLSLEDTKPLTKEAHPFLAPALEKPLDLLYADFDHYPHAILTIFTKYLPVMSEYASIFIDSASTYLPSYLVIEQTVEQMNRGKLPAIFLSRTTRAERDKLAEIVATRRFTHISMAEKKDRAQNGLSWIRMEPVNIVPYPLTEMRGFSAKTMPREALESFFQRGHLPERHVKSAFLHEQLARSIQNLSEDEMRAVLAQLAARGK
ncbi:MAG: class I SAM-dependent methyltransferase [Byssovorax sp.]